MKALRLRVDGFFNSFRVPYEMKYQRTFLYPPRTTLIGLLAGAMGLGEGDELEQLYQEVTVGVVMDALQGTARDLWIITKIKYPQPERSPVTREILFNPTYWIYYHSEKIPNHKIGEAFTDPAYPTTLGRSDELALIKTVDEVELNETEDVYYRSTVLPFDYRDKKYSFETLEPSDMMMRLPRTFRIPTRFTFKRDQRIPTDYKIFSHIYNLGVKIDGTGWSDGERNLQLY